LVGAKFYNQPRSSHKGWVEKYLGDDAKGHHDEWTASIAVGSRSFIENVKALLGFRAKGREEGISFERTRLSIRLFSGSKKTI